MAHSGLVLGHAGPMQQQGVHQYGGQMQGGYLPQEHGGHQGRARNGLGFIGEMGFMLGADLDRVAEGGMGAAPLVHELTGAVAGAQPPMLGELSPLRRCMRQSELTLLPLRTRLERAAQRHAGACMARQGGDGAANALWGPAQDCF